MTVTGMDRHAKYCAVVKPAWRLDATERDSKESTKPLALQTHNRNIRLLHDLPNCFDISIRQRESEALSLSTLNAI